MVRIHQLYAVPPSKCSRKFSGQSVQQWVVHPDARGGFQKYPVEIVMVDYNESPTCTVASEIVVLSDLGPMRIPHFLINSSVGLNEEWQNLIYCHYSKTERPSNLCWIGRANGRQQWCIITRNFTRVLRYCNLVGRLSR